MHEPILNVSSRNTSKCCGSGLAKDSDLYYKQSFVNLSQLLRLHLGIWRQANYLEFSILK